MFRQLIAPALAGALVLTTGAAGAARKSPAWLSIESPVSPYDVATRGAAFLVHADIRGEAPAANEVTGSVEGLVNGTRRTIPLRLDNTSHAGVFAVRRQWPSEGTWLVRVSLMSTTAIVTVDQHGDVTGARVPTVPGSGTQLPRPVSAGEIDSTLAAAAKR